MREVSEILIYGSNTRHDLSQRVTGKLLIYVFQQQYIKALKKGFRIFSHFPKCGAKCHVKLYIKIQIKPTKTIT